MNMKHELYRRRQARIRDVKDGTVFFLKQFSTQRIINQRSNWLMSMAGNTT